MPIPLQGKSTEEHLKTSTPYFLIPLFLLGVPFAQAQVTHLDPEIKTEILKGPPLSTIYKVSEIPKAALKTCGFKLANPDEEFQATDVILDEKLLMRRLIWGAFTDKYFILHYEMGGMGHSYHILVFAKECKCDSPILWRATSIPFQDYGDFWEALAGQALDDSRDYGY